LKDYVKDEKGAR